MAIYTPPKRHKRIRFPRKADFRRPKSMTLGAMELLYQGLSYPLNYAKPGESVIAMSVPDKSKKLRDNESVILTAGEVFTQQADAQGGTTEILYGGPEEFWMEFERYQHQFDPVIFPELYGFNKTMPVEFVPRKILFEQTRDGANILDARNTLYAPFKQAREKLVGLLGVHFAMREINTKKAVMRLSYIMEKFDFIARTSGTDPRDLSTSPAGQVFGAPSSTEPQLYGPEDLDGNGSYPPP